MRSTSLWILLLSSSVFACRSADEARRAPGQPAATASAAAEDPRPAPKRYGAPIQSTSRQALSEVLASPGAHAGKTVVVEGQVRRACSRKGCWMELAASKEADAPGCRVTFKDYGFFVPTDSAGSSARVEASVEVAKLEPSYVAHMEQEGARFANKKADGSAEEVRLVATGVELWR